MRLRARFVGGVRRESVCLSQVQIDPPSSVAYAPAFPEGKPSVGSASLIMRASNFNPSKNILQKSKSALQKASPNEKVTHHSLPLRGGRKLQAV